MTMTRQQWEEQWIGVAQNTYDANSKELLNQLDDLYEKCEEKITDWLNDLLLKALDQGVSRTDLWDWQRYKSFEKRLGWEISNLGGKEISALAEMMERSIKDTYAKTEVPGATITGDFTLMNDIAVKQLVNTRWSNKLYSSAIWDNKSAMLSELRKGLRDTLVLGESKDKLVDHINKTFKKGFANSDRLVRTELMNVINQGQRKKYKDSGVEKLEIVVVEDSRICSSCEGRSGEIIDVNSSDIPPFHPRCRCCVVAVVDWSKLQQEGIVEDAETTAERTQVTYSQEQIKTMLEYATKSKLSRGMGKANYKEFIDTISQNKDIANMYIKYFEKLDGINRKQQLGKYYPSENRITYCWTPTYNGRNKFATICHEFGHFFDAKGKFKCSYNEIETIKSKINSVYHNFKAIPSSSDEFLKAMRSDREVLRQLRKSDGWKAFRYELMSKETSSGLQDAIDGMFGEREKIRFYHGDSYYNRRFEYLSLSNRQMYHEALKELGFDVNYSEAEKMCRDYDTASELWANITSALSTGGDELEFFRKYMPNALDEYQKIIKGAE